MSKQIAKSGIFLVVMSF